MRAQVATRGLPCSGAAYQQPHEVTIMPEQAFQLRLQKGPEPGKVYPLMSASLTIGRDPMAEITINDPEVSRQHARLSRTLSGYRIQDLGSTNGTFVDGMRLGGEPQELQPGQIIAIGSGVTLVYQAVPSEADEAATVLDVEAAAAAEGMVFPAEEAEVPEAEEEERSTDTEFLGAPEPEEEPAVDFSETAAAAVEPEPAPEEEEEAAPEPAATVPPEEMTMLDAPRPDLEAEEPAVEIEYEKPPEPVETPWPAYPAVSADAGTESELEDEEPLQGSVISSAAPPPPPKRNDNRRIITIIALVFLLLVCCCCAGLVFIYQIGGDWLLQQMGVIP